MNIGWIGLGKLGGPIAGELARQGHRVYGYDSANGPEFRFPSGVSNSGTVEYLLQAAPDLVFVAVPTPHEERFEGITRLPDARADFDYTALQQVLTEIGEAAKAPVTVVVVSTCLPGTYKRTLTHPMPPNVRYVHSPSFIGMGSVVEDFLHPEFWLIGTPTYATPERKLVELYRSLNADVPIIETNVTTAEAIKIAYNTAISMKLALVNTWAQISDQLGIDVDDITGALELATRRIVSPAYMRAGMGDGGPCHPRDLIAASWLVSSLKDMNLYDLFGAVAQQRVDHTEWLAWKIEPGATIFGRAFKPNTTIETGSPALLLASLLDDFEVEYTQAEDPEPGEFNVVATAHDRYRKIRWPLGSRVLDPFGIIEPQEGVTLIRPGRR